LDKAPDAFRTISEVADDLDVPQHVLRFWETRFTQIKPMKRSGGRRYYRPDDVDLLRGIRRLLYGEGYTIRGVQRILREQGIKAVQGLAAAEATPPSATRPSGRHAADPEAHRTAAAHVGAALPDDDVANADHGDADDGVDHDDDAHDDDVHDDGDHDDEDHDDAEVADRPAVAPRPQLTRPPAVAFAPAARATPVAPRAAPSVTPPRRVPGEAAARLRAALDDLTACKALIDDALKGSPPDIFALK
jgi:DNA-binding transcriptional MerR regulator